MHQRTWLSILTLPFVTAFTYPVVFQQAPPAAQVETSKGVQDPLAGLSDIQDVLDRVRDNYVDTPDLVKVIGGGIEAALERAHPLNAYLSPEELRLPDPGPAQVGLRVIKKAIWAQVVTVTPGSPAARAGIQPGDVIRKIDGESVGGFSAWTLERKLKGPAGSELDLVNYDSGSGQLKKISLKREIIQRPSIVIRKEAKGVLVGLPDLSPGRAEELKRALAGLDHAVPLVVDLRNCGGGDLSEAALVAGMFGGEGAFATIQEAGKPDRVLSSAKTGMAGFSALAALQGVGTAGPAELLSAFLKKQSVLTAGERTAGLGVERNRFALKQGGAVELVNRRWLGADGEKLDRQGVLPGEALRGLLPDEDPLPKVLELLAGRLKKAA